MFHFKGFYRRQRVGERDILKIPIKVAEGNLTLALESHSLTEEGFNPHLSVLVHSCRTFLLVN